MREENAIELIHLPQNAFKNGHDRFHLHFKMPAENALERIHLPENACKNSYVRSHLILKCQQRMPMIGLIYVGKMSAEWLYIILLRQNACKHVLFASKCWQNAHVMLH
jgi:hypothetical protein